MPDKNLFPSAKEKVEKNADKRKWKDKERNKKYKKILQSSNSTTVSVFHSFLGT
jgi:hypothetical protein